MFGKKNTDLEQQLCREREAHARDIEELEALRGRLEPEQQELKKLQDACRKELRELEELKCAFEEAQASRAQALDLEEKQRQEAFDAELLLRKKETEENIHKNVTALSDNYSYYLSQLKLLMDILTKVSITVGKSFLTQEGVDTAELFREMVNDEIDPGTFLRTEHETGPQASHEETEP